MADLDNPKRISKVWVTRYMIWLYLHCEAGITAVSLAKRFSRNRPSILRGIRIIKHRLKYHKELRDEYQAISEKLEGASSDTPPEDME